MRTENIYCTLDTETFGGASTPKGIYHLAGIIHNRKGEILGCFNYLIAEHYDEIEKDDYAKRNFHKYAEMVANGEVTVIPSERMAVDCVNALCDYYNVKFMMAFNSGFDYTKTLCRELIAEREFIDIWLMALQTLGCLKKYSKFCHENEFRSSSKKSCATSAESFYAYLTGNVDYKEEHTALEDSKIEMEIFLACISTHKKFTKNCHCFDYEDKFKLFPRWQKKGG